MPVFVFEESVILAMPKSVTFTTSVSGLVHDIGRLDVAMNDIVGMRVVQGICYPGGNRQHARQRQQCIWLGERHQIAALEKFHRDVGKVVLFTGIEDRHDVRMIEAACRLRLAEEAFLHFLQLVRLELLRQGQGLDGDDTADLGIGALIHHAHGALAKLLLDLETAEHRLFSGVQHQRPTRMAASAGG